MRDHRKRKHLSAAIAVALWVLLFPKIAATAVQIESPPETPASETAVLVKLLQEQISIASPQVAKLEVRVTIGAPAFRSALERNRDEPIVAAYLSSTEFAAALGDGPAPRHITAVFSNPDPLDQLALARAILSRARIAAFDSPNAHPLVERLMERGVTAIPVTPNEGIDALLRDAAPFDVILALPDPTVLTPANIGHVVRTLYQQHKVIIGYSDTLTRVGSLASVYPTAEGIARAVRGVLEEYAGERALPPPMFVPDVSVSVNDRLARSLNIVLPDVTDIVSMIRSKREARR